ncbi:MAG: hypothetical protein KIS94_05110 [Chitinophagales bacterium]|nr:hypothetical protein [Chitinophagales bacterium]
MLFSSVVANDTTYKVIGLAAPKTPPYNPKLLMAIINATGSIIKYKTLIDTSNTIDFGVFANTLIKTPNKTFALAGYTIDSTIKILFAKFNASLDSFSIYTYYAPDVYAYFGNTLLNADTSGFFISGVKTIQSTNNANVVLLKIDAEGNKVWEKSYDQYKQDYAKSMVLLANGNILLGCIRSNLNQTNEHANTWLLEVDTGGNIVRQWFDPNDSTYVAEGLRQTQDGGFIYGAQKKALQTVGGVYKIATVVKMDSNFTKQWTFSDGRYNTTTAIVDLEELPDGSFIGCGNKPYYNTDSSILSGWIVKLDANGNVIWNKTYAGLQTSFSHNYLTDIDVLPDGSLIAVGQCQNTTQQPPQVGWFLKLDSNGCEIENCLVGIDPQTPEGGLNSQIQVTQTQRVAVCSWK